MPNRNNNNQAAVTEAENLMNAFSAVQDPLSEEGRKALSDALVFMIQQLRDNQMVTGTQYYDNLLKTAEDVQNYLGNMNRKDPAAEENLYASLLYLQGQADRYLDYKKEDGQSKGTEKEEKRIASAEMIRSFSALSADKIGAKINNYRQIRLAGTLAVKGMMDPSLQIKEQTKKLLQLQEALKATTGFTHGSGDAFKAMMKDLEEAIDLSKAVAGIKLYNPEANQKYLKSLDQLQKDTNAYLNYKKNNNDFGETSTKRIRTAGSLELVLKQIVPAAAFYSAQLDPDKDTAQKWFDSMTKELAVKLDKNKPEAGLKTPVNMFEPLSGSRVFIADPENYVSEVQLNHAMDPKTSYKDKLKTVQQYMNCRHMAFARIGGDNKPLHPYRNGENVAEWIRNESVTKKEDFTLSHKLHLYKMAKENRLFVQRINSDYSPEGCKFDQITVGKDNECVIVQDEQTDKKKCRDVYENNNRHLKPDRVLTSIYNKIQTDRRLTKTEKNSILKETGKFQNQEILIHIGSYFPEWFRNKEDAELLDRLCSSNTTLHRQSNAQEKETFRNDHVMWNEKELKAAKSLLNQIGVKSFDELMNHKISYEGEPAQKPKTGFQLADRLIRALQKNKDIRIDGKYYAMHEGSVVNVNRDVNRTPEDYIKGFEQLEKAALKEMLNKDGTLTELLKTAGDHFGERPGIDENYRVMERAFEQMLNGMRGAAKQLKRAEVYSRGQNRALYYDEVSGAANMMNNGLLRVRVRAEQTGVLRDRDLKMLRYCNQLSDLQDLLAQGVNNPLKSITYRTNRLASRLADVTAEHKIRTLQQKMKDGALSEEDQKELQEAKKVLTDRKTRQKAVAKFAKDPFVQNTMRTESDKSELAKSDIEFLKSYTKTAQLVKQAENQPGKAKEDLKEIKAPEVKTIVLNK